MGNFDSGNTALATTTAYGNQRKIDRTQNGVLWGLKFNVSSNGGFDVQRSTDSGITWASAGFLTYSSSSANYVANGSLFIDLDDYAQVVYKDPGNGYIYFVRGTPNAARTAYTWSAAFTVSTVANNDYPDLFVHRDVATSGAWVAHIVNSYAASGSSGATYRRLAITAAGVVSLISGSTVDVGSNTLNAHTYPSIDGRHTGDGKTIATVSGAAQPDVFVGWSAGQAGSGFGIRFRKATYAAGSWTWGTEREIDNAHYIQGSGWLNCLFDGTRVIMAGFDTANAPQAALFLHDRDAADTTTTPRILVAPTTGADYRNSGSASYDSAGNVYFFGEDVGASAGLRGVSWEKWNRSGGVLSARTVFDTTGNANPYVAARRGYTGQAIDYVYTDGTSSPYTVASGRIALNQNPTAATPLTPADNATIDSSIDQTVTFQHNDPDGDAATSWRIRYRPAGTTVGYAYLTGSTTAANGATVTATVPAGTWAGQIAWEPQTYDSSNAEGAWGPIRTVTGRPAALAALTGGQGGTSASALNLYNQAQSERALRALSLV